MSKWVVGKTYQNIGLTTNYRLIKTIEEVCDCMIVTYLYLLDWDVYKGKPTKKDFKEANLYNKTYKKNPEGFFTQI